MALFKMNFYLQTSVEVLLHSELVGFGVIILMGRYMLLQFLFSSAAFAGSEHTLC